MFDGARLKLERAKQHIADFETLSKAFANSRPYSYFIHGDVKKGFPTSVNVTVRFTKPVPINLALILGDTIHNLRSALDHAVWELIGIDGGTQDRYAKLPTGDTRISFESSARGMKTPDQRTKDFLVKLAIYPDGLGEALYGLNLLNNADKHRVITPVARAGHIGGITTIDPDTGQRFDVGTIITDPDMSDEVRVFTAFPGHAIDANQDLQLAVEICFGEVDAFPAEPILPTLVHLVDRVDDTLRQFALYVGTRI